MTVAELEDRMSLAEVSRWARFEADEPFLSTRIDLAGGIVASVVANVNRGKGSPPYDALDFMPLLGQQRERATVEIARQRLGFPEPVDEEDAILQRLVAAYG